MTDTERTQMYIAYCLACSLSKALRDCNLCPFKVGLQIQGERLDTPNEPEEPDEI